MRQYSKCYKSKQRREADNAIDKHMIEQKYEKELNRDSKHHNVSYLHEQLQLKTIETALNQLTLGSPEAKQYILRINNGSIRSKLNELYSRPIRGPKIDMSQMNWLLSQMLNCQSLYHPKYQSNSEQIDTRLINNIIKNINEYKIVQQILIKKQIINPSQYVALIRTQSFQTIKAANNLISNHVPTYSSSHLQNSIVYQFEMLLCGAFNQNKSKLQHWHPKIHNYFVQLHNLFYLSKQQTPKKDTRVGIQRTSIKTPEPHQIKDNLKKQTEISLYQSRKLELLQRQLAKIKQEKVKAEKTNQTQRKYEENKFNLQKEKLQQKIQQQNSSYEKLFKKMPILSSNQAKLNSQIAELRGKQFDLKNSKTSYDHLQQQKSIVQAKLKSIQTEYKNLKQKYDGLVIKCQEVKRQQLSKFSKQQQAAQMRLATIISEKSYEFQNLKRQFSRRQDQIKRISDNYKIVEEQKDNNITQLSGKLLAYQMEITELKKQNDSLAEKCQRLQIKIEEKAKKSYDKIIDELRNQNDQLSKALIDKDQQISAIAQRCKNLRQKSNILLKQFLPNKIQLAGIKRFIEDAQKKFTGLIKQYNQRWQEILNYHKILQIKALQDSSQQNKEILAKIKAQHEKDIEFYQGNVGYLQQGLKQLKLQLACKDKEIIGCMKLKTQYQFLQQDYEQLKGKMSKITKVQDTDTQDTKDYDSSIRDLHLELQKISKQLQIVKKQHFLASKLFQTKIAEERQASRMVVTEIDQKLKKSTILMEQNNVEINKLKGNIQTLNQENYSVKASNIYLVQQIQSFTSTYNALQQENKRTLNQNASLIEQNDLKYTLLKESQGNNEELSSRCREIQQKFKISKQFTEQLKEKYADLQQQYSVLMQTMKDVESKLTSIALELEKEKESNQAISYMIHQNNTKYDVLFNQKQKIEQQFQQCKETSAKNSFSLQQKKKMQKRIKDYKEQIDHLTNQVDILNENLMEMTQISLQSTPQPDAKVQQQDTYKEQIQQKDDIINQLQRQVDRFGEDRRDLQDLMVTQKQQFTYIFEQLQRKIKDMDAQRIQANRAKDALQSECNVFNAKLQNNMSQLIQRQKMMAPRERLDIQNDLLFQNDVLEGQIQHKKYLKQVIQDYMRFKIWKSKLIFRFDVQNKVNFHRYIDGKEHLVIVLKMKNGNYLAAYTEGSFQPQKVSTQDALIVSITNHETFRLLDKSKRAITYDEYYIIFGNSEIRIRSQEDKIFSNFAISNGYYETKGKKVPILLGGGPSDRQLQFQHYEIYQLDVIFDL